VRHIPQTIFSTDALFTRVDAEILEQRETELLRAWRAALGRG
jgi:hypothetical protein